MRSTHSLAYPASLKLTHFQVPEDLQSMLNDSSLFANNAELTTKEILKRYGDIGRVPQATINSPGIPGGHRPSQGRQAAPVATRVDTDPGMWQNESSVRHVSGAGPQQPAASYGPSNMQSTPPRDHYNLANPSLPYANQTGSQDSLGLNGSPNRHSHRPSAYHNQGAVAS